MTTLPVEIFHHIFSWLPLSFVIANCSLVSRHFYRISRNLSWVTELNLSTFYKINDNVLENLFRTQFQKNNHLKVLNLAYCVHITDASLKLIAEYFPSLQELDLSHCRSITSHGLVVISNSLSKLTKLCLKRTSKKAPLDLDVKTIFHSDSVLKRSLQHLKVEGFALNTDDWMYLWETFPQLHDDPFFLKSLLKCPRLSHLIRLHVVGDVLVRMAKMWWHKPWALQTLVSYIEATDYLNISEQELTEEIFMSHYTRPEAIQIRKQRAKVAVEFAKRAYECDNHNFEIQKVLMEALYRFLDLYHDEESEEVAENRVLLDKLHDSFSQIQQSDIQTQEMLRKFQKNPFNINAYSYFKNDILSKIGRLVAQGKIDETKSVIEEGQKLLSRSHRRMKFLLLQLAYYYHRKGQLNEALEYYLRTISSFNSHYEPLQMTQQVAWGAYRVATLLNNSAVATQTMTLLQKIDTVGTSSETWPKIEECIQRNECTLAATGENFQPQYWYFCITCGLNGYNGICASCAATCHANHLTFYDYFSHGCYCDCINHPQFRTQKETITPLDEYIFVPPFNELNAEVDQSIDPLPQVQQEQTELQEDNRQQDEGHSTVAQPPPGHEDQQKQ